MKRAFLRARRGPSLPCFAGDAAQAALFTRFVPALTHAAAHSMSWKQREERRVPNGDEELIAPSEHERREAGA